MEIVAIRSLVALPCILLFFRYEGQRGLPTTKQHKLEYIRGASLFPSYTTFMMGLAALPLAEIEAIRFSGPLMITLLSVMILGEKVGPRRWIALAVGFLGVLLIIRPGSASFNLGSVFILISVLFYALTVIFTRKLQSQDSSATIAYFSSPVYLAAALVLAPLPALVGELPNAHPSVAFLLRAWTANTLGFGHHVWVGFGLGGLDVFLIARLQPGASFGCHPPFEYLSLPINIMWGFLIWREIPTWVTLAGAALTLSSGMYILIRERTEQPAQEAV